MSPESSENNSFLDLRRFSDGQNTAIQNLYQDHKNLETPVFTDYKNPQWNRLWEVIWEKGEHAFQGTAEVVRDDSNFDDSILPDTVPTHSNIAAIPDGLGKACRFKLNNILIRNEYEEAQRAVLWVCGCKGPFPYDNMVFSGSPGIGKTTFLFLLLLRRLAAGLPTGLQIDAGYSLLFWKGGVFKFGEQEYSTSYMDLDGTGDPLSRIWVLVDSNPKLTQPAGAFSDCGPFFVVVAASPRPGWTMKTTSYPFFMKPWSFLEVLQLRSLVIPDDPLSEHALWVLYSDYGASPRHLFAPHPDAYISLVQQEVGKVSPQMAHRLLHDPNPAWDAPDLLVLIEPLPTSRFVPQMRIVTDHVSELLLQKNQYYE